MLKIKMESPSIVKVDEYLISFMETRHKVVRYDLVNMVKKVNDESWRKMSQSDLDWVQKYYLPKIEK